MDKRVQNLERLLQKLQFRYGSEDDLVLQLKHELSASRVSEFKNPVMANHFQRQPSRQETFNPSAIDRRQSAVAAHTGPGN